MCGRTDWHDIKSVPQHTSHLLIQKAVLPLPAGSRGVIIEGIYQMFMRDSEVKKFRKYAKDNSTEMFVRSLFPDKFRDIVTQCFLDNNDSFAKLFNDPDFYQKVQEAMAQELYKTLRKE